MQNTKEKYKMQNAKHKIQNAMGNSKTESTRPTYILQGMENMKYKMHNIKYKNKKYITSTQTQNVKYKMQQPDREREAYLHFMIQPTAQTLTANTGSQKI